jgi:hypothetical protein
MQTFSVAIFGSAKIKKNDPIYKSVKHLSTNSQNGNRSYHRRGHGLIAASIGHKKGKKNMNVRTIGVGVKLPWKQGFNEAVEYKQEFERFSGRLDEFMLLSNAVIVAPGGIGTLLELFYTWQLVQVHHICNIPIILMGEQWLELISWIKENPLKNKYLTDKDFNLVYYAKNEEEVLDMIHDVHNHFKNGGKDFCLNYKRYNNFK